MKIKEIKAYEVLDSRGNPTVMVKVADSRGNYGWSIVPSGASTGEFEAVELRDGDKKRYHGKGVLKAIANINKEIAPALIGMNVTKQAMIDKKMIALDGTPNKGRLGANAILGVSLACMYCAAKVRKVAPHQYIANLYGKADPTAIMPMPMMNIINGGEHADNNLDIQEFMIVPTSAKSLAEAVRMGSEIFQTLKKLLKEAGHNTAVGDEGGFAPSLCSNVRALEFIMNAIEQTGYKPGEDIHLTLDVAASEFYDPKTKKYNLVGDELQLKTDGMIEYYVDLVKRFPIVSIEDGLDQNDWNGYVKLTEALGKKIQIVGDDFFCTNPKRLTKGIKKGACNAILIKLNQIGTLTETIKCIQTAHAAGYKTVISHRSGESEDTTIADLAVGTGAGQIKTGSLSRTDRTAKYNRLIVIESDSAPKTKLG